MSPFRSEERRDWGGKVFDGIPVARRVDLSDSWRYFVTRR
jgi:hypothetical protein